MPRIRDIKDLVFYKPDRRRRYKHIESLFRASIDWSLIERHFPDMLRVAISIKAGRMTPSTILRRLGSGSVKNKLYFAFREHPPKPRENDPRPSRTHSRMLVLTAAIAVSALLTWVCLDEILIQDRPVPAHR